MDPAATDYGHPEPEYSEAAAEFARVLRKHDKPRGGLATGTPEVVRELGNDSCISFIAGRCGGGDGLGRRTARGEGDVSGQGENVGC